MRIILLSVASIIITAAFLFHPLYPAELGLFASGWLVALSVLPVIWYELKHKAYAEYAFYAVNGPVPGRAF